MLKKRPAAREAGGASAKKPSRHPSRFTLRFLKYAVGDSSIVGTPQRAPAFGTIFFEYLNAFPVEDDVWLEKDAVSLCALAMYTLYFMKYTFIGGIAPKKTDQDADMEDEDEEEVEVVDDVPKALLPKLVNILVQLENIFSFADNLATELDWIHRVSRKFRAATRGVISSSKSGAAALAMQSIEYFSTQIDDDTAWIIAGTQVTMESTDEFFLKSKAVHIAKQQELGIRNTLTRFDSFTGHLNETQHDVNLIKEALYNLSKMVCTHRIHRIHRIHRTHRIHCVQIEIQDTKLNILLDRSDVTDSQASISSTLSIDSYMARMQVITAAATAVATPVPSPLPAPLPPPPPSPPPAAGDDDDVAKA
jgi:hypothetical protein